MKRQDEAVTGQDRKKENEMWMRLLKELNTEKERLETPAEEPPEENAQNKTEQSEPSKERKPLDADSSAPVEPNES